ncbi:50S ribosomal protein L9 [bacterium]|nr:50S ribosomal protein L9 [bacterium]
MKIILTETLGKLGKAGDVVSVADGYGRNYLIPQKLAILASRANLNQITLIKKQKESKEEKKKRSLEKYAESLDGISCEIVVKVGENDKIYGSVTPVMIAEAIAKKGFEIDRKQIELEEPINTLGVYIINLNLHPEIQPKIKLWVVEES